jgi:hypothetical protein
VSRRAAAIGAAILLCLLLSPATAPATSVSSSRLHALASAFARGDGPALAQLRAVTSVAGRPAAVGALFASGSAAQLRSRAQVLASTSVAPGAPAVAPERARAIAAAILAGSRYGRATVPDPVLNLFNSIGRWLGQLASETPGGPTAFWALAAIVILALAGYGARRALRRLEPEAGGRGTPAPGGGEDPAALERAARAAEEQGAFGEAVRLRFRAGLLTLGARSAIEYRPSLLAADVARRLHSPDFDALNDTFERVAYGGVCGRAGDAADARRRWDALLSERPR